MVSHDKAYQRHDGRISNQLRNTTIETNVSRYAEGSCLITQGNTKILCTATIDESVPSFLRHKQQGWVTCEYSMLPRATHHRIDRKRMLDDGRVKEIQRLIGRSMRACIDFKLLGERQIKLDCDVLDADGGTRTASITGAFIALHEAITYIMEIELIKKSPILFHIAAVSCGIVNNIPLLDLNYEEDSQADVDANFVLNDKNDIIEIQATSEGNTFNHQQYNQLYDLATQGISTLIEKQKSVLN